MTIGSFYRRSFERRPWLTLAITNGGLTLLADVLAQSVERITRTDLAPQPDWDYARSARFLTYGTAMGPFLAEWNKFLEFKFPIRSPSGAMLVGGLARRVMADQILMAPITMGLFVGAMGMMEGRLTYESLKEKFGEVRSRVSDHAAVCACAPGQLEDLALPANVQLWRSSASVRTTFLTM